VKEHEIVLRLVHEGLLARKTGRADNHIHASDIPKWCSRRFVLCDRLQRSFHPPKTISVAQALTFSIGEKIEEIVGEALAIHSPHIQVLEDICIQKKFGKTVMSGSIDKGLVLTRPKHLFVPLEVKSIKPDEFDTLTEPKLSHTVQVQTYLFLLSGQTKVVGRNLKSKSTVTIPLTGDTFNGRGVIVYICKTQKPEPIKTFLIEKDKTFEKWLKAVRKEIDGKTLPPRVCSHQGSALARECPEVNYCFEEN
jgi:hypothetical protein